MRVGFVPFHFSYGGGVEGAREDDTLKPGGQRKGAKLPLPTFL